MGRKQEKKRWKQVNIRWRIEMKTEEVTRERRGKREDTER